MTEYINGEQQTDLPRREILQYLYPYISFFENMKHNCPFLQHGFCTVSGFLRVQERVGENNSTVEALVKQDLKPAWSRLTSAVIYKPIVCSLDMMWWECNLTSMIIPPQTSQPWSNHEKNIKFQLRDMLQTDCFSKPRDIKTKETLKTRTSQVEPEEIWQLNRIWFSGWVPGTEN